MKMRNFMRRAAIKAFRNDDGGPLVETALTMPILIMLVIGPVELARVAYGAIECANAARAAASYGMQNSITVSDTTGIQTVASNDAANIAGVLTTSPSISYICSDGSASTGLNTDCSTSQIEKVLTVTTSATLPALIQLPGLPKSYTVHGLAVQKVLKN
jgi:Flp pilus assembly protein TadG